MKLLPKSMSLCAFTQGMLCLQVSRHFWLICMFALFKKYWENHIAICWEKRKRGLKYKLLSRKIVNIIDSFSKKTFYQKSWQNPTNQFFNKSITLARAHARVMNIKINRRIKFLKRILWRLKIREMKIWKPVRRITSATIFFWPTQETLKSLKLCRIFEEVYTMWSDLKNFFLEFKSWYFRKV